MKKILFPLFAAFFAIAAQAQPVASVVLSNPPVENNLSLHIATYLDAITNFTTKSGLACIEIPANNYGYFKVTNNAITQSDNNLIITITYFDEGTSDFQFQYNATGGNNYKGQNIKKTGSNTWITAKIAVTDASFRKAQNNSCDFRISANNFIREITITKGTLNPANEPLVSVTGSSFSEFTGKSVAGYQAWFQTGNTTSGWFHWNGTTPPSPGKLNFEIYPDISEYDNADLAQTGFANFGNGQSAKLFNSANTNVINKHFNWMKTYGIDGAAVQRFINGIGSAINNSPASHLAKIKNAAEANNRIFYICYDISSTGLDATWADIIKFDWVYNVEQAFELTKSPAYAKVGNKPVVQVWGTGFTGNHPGTEQETIDLINFLKARGCYVIGGVPTWWRTQTGDSKPNFINAYNAYDMISPWSVGRFGDNNGANSLYNSPMQGDKTYCDARNIKYMPVLFPGFAWSQWNGSATGTSGNVNEAPRNAGEFMWHQAKNIKNLGVSQMYFAMFDEYDEGTAIMKAATDWTEIPTNQYFLTTSTDGYWLSSDFQLRVAGAAIAMLKSAAAAPPNVPVPHSEGPVFYRNNFESRTTPYNYYDGQYHNNGTFPLDPCFKNPAQISVSSVNSQTTAILQTANAKTGNYVAEIKGNATANNGSYYYKFADVKIVVEAGMEISFEKYAINEQGKYTSAGLQFSDGSHLYDLSAGNGTLNTWTEHAYNIDSYAGKTITGLLLGYKGNAAGNFNAYFDNILIQDGDGSGEEPEIPQDCPEIRTVRIRSFYSEKDALAGVNNEKYLKDNGGTLQWVDAADNASTWYEIPADGSTTDFYFKNLSTGKYIYRDNANSLTSCSGWSWNSALLSANNAKTDYYKFREIAGNWEWATLLVNVADADLNNVTNSGAFVLSAINTNHNTCSMPLWSTNVVMSIMPNGSNAFTAIHLDQINTGVKNPDCNNIVTNTETPLIATTLYISDGKIYATNSDAMLTVYNTVGRQIPNSNLQQGIYIVVVQVGGRMLTYKVMF